MKLHGLRLSRFRDFFTLLSHHFAAHSPRRAETLLHLLHVLLHALVNRKLYASPTIAKKRFRVCLGCPLHRRLPTLHSRPPIHFCSSCGCYTPFLSALSPDDKPLCPLSLHSDLG
jgi:hypothetical protein